MIRFQRRGKGLMSEINIIPFTDIVLVILVVFMVTTPMLVQSAIKVNLPESALNDPATQAKDIDWVIKGDKEFYVNDKAITGLDGLQAALAGLPVSSTSVVVRADKAVSYGLVAQVLGVAQQAGAKKLELLVQFKK